jgi:hypothetical protein
LVATVVKVDKLADVVELELADSLPPTTVPVLLRRLQMNNAPAKLQKAAIRGWLDHNTASPALRNSIRRNGYGLLLGDKVRQAG